MPRNVTVTFKDGTSHVYQGVPDDATPAQVEARAAQEFNGKAVAGLDGGAAAAPRPGPIDMGPEGVSTAGVVGQGAIDSLKSAGDTALSLGTGMISQPVSGIAGLVAAPFVGADKAADIVHKTQEAFTWQPRSDAGKRTAAVIAKPLKWAADKSDAAGQVVADATGSPLAGALTTTAIQSAPALAAPEVRGAFASAGRGAASTVRGIGTAARANTTAVDAARAATEANSASTITNTGAVTDNTLAAKANSTAARANSTTTANNTKATAANTGAINKLTDAVQKAKDYALSVKLDWDSLGDSTRAKLTQIAQDGGDLTKLSPDAVARESRLQSLDVPVPATRGQLERNPATMRREANVAGTDGGKPINDTYLAANQALLDNLDVLKGKVSGTGKTAATATNLEQAGSSVQGAARGKAQFVKKQVDELYKTARATEPDAQASLTPVTDLLQSNPEIQHLGWVQSWLDKAAKLKQKQAVAAGDPAAAEGPVAMTHASLAELADLRSQALAISRTGGKEGLYAGNVARAIDTAMEDVPAGADAWKAANQAFRKYKTEFTDQGAVADLVDNASRTDRATALESTVKTVTNGSLEDVRNIKRSLLTGGDATTRTAGKQAWRDLRSQVVQQIKDDATKSPSIMADGADNLQVGALKRSIDKIGPDKLNELFGPGTARQLDNILKAAIDVKTMPAAGPPVGSTTMQNVLTFLEKGLDKVPIVGGPAVDILKGAAQIKKIGAGAREAKRATTTPLNEALSKASSQARKDRIIGNPEEAKPLVPLSSMYSQKEAKK